MNNYQKDYAIATAVVQEIEEAIAKVEREYIMTQGITTSDGSIPAYVYCIDNDEMFEIANQAISKKVIDLGLEDKLNKAKEILHEAEESLMNYGVSIAPEILRDTLLKGIKENYRIRCKMLDLVFKLDTSTVN